MLTFRGKIASKRRYFYGVILFVMMTSTGIPVEAAFLPGRNSDVKGLQVLLFGLLERREVRADRPFTDYYIEDACCYESIRLNPLRKKNSKRGDSFIESIYKKDTRRKIETVFSVIKAKLPAHIHAITLDGFFTQSFQLCFYLYFNDCFFLMATWVNKQKNLIVLR